MRLRRSLHPQPQGPGLAALQALGPLGWEGHGKECPSVGFTGWDEAIGVAVHVVCVHEGTLFCLGPPRRLHVQRTPPSRPLCVSGVGGFDKETTAFSLGKHTGTLRLAFLCQHRWQWQEMECRAGAEQEPTGPCTMAPHVSR